MITCGYTYVEIPLYRSIQLNTTR